VHRAVEATRHTMGNQSEISGFSNMLQFILHMPAEIGICGSCTKYKLDVAGRVPANDLGERQRRGVIICEKAAASRCFSVWTAICAPSVSFTCFQVSAQSSADISEPCFHFTT
jgi:hypothetical protein